jgi:hypothetical protein
LKSLERVKGIEPSSSAWKAVALPLSYTRIGRIPFALWRPSVKNAATGFHAKPRRLAQFVGHPNFFRKGEVRGRKARLRPSGYGAAALARFALKI